MARISPADLWRSTFPLGLAGAVLLWMAFPPVGWWWLAWFAPVPWLLLVHQQRWSGRRPYVWLWLAGLLHWVAMLEGIRKAHWLNHFGLLLLAAYLALYLPLFVGLTRAIVHRLRVPLVLAAPVIWTGLEVLRGYLFTGFSLGLLAHTHYQQPLAIQFADLFGGYGVSFVIMMVAAAVAQWFIEDRRPRFARSWILAGSILMAALGYNLWRYYKPPNREPLPEPLNVVAVQATFNTVFVYDPARNRRIFRTYWEQSLQVAQEHPDLDVIIWPESTFTENLPEVLITSDSGLPTSERQHAAHLQQAFQDKAKEAAEQLNQDSPGDGSSKQIHLLVGTETMSLVDRERQQYNTALLIDPTGGIVDRYYKMHPVMFGEYVPFGHTFPALYQWFPMGQGLTPGDGPATFEIKGVRLSPSICFESTVPHLIRRQVLEETRAGRSPHVLVNVTHDGWFWGSSILDLQLACAVFRAVELRRPMLVAANAGLSAVIEPSGQVVQAGPREGRATLFVRLEEGGWESFYLRFGDFPAALCLLATICWAFGAWRSANHGDPL